MKKLLIVAALLATATPVFAAKMAMPEASPKTCMLMPLMPGCMAMMKDHMKMTPPVMPKMAMPAMPMMPKMPTCVRAPAGAGHLFDCTM